MQSLAHQFLDFCRSKPADEGYNYFDTRHCACAQFASFLGRKYWGAVEASLGKAIPGHELEGGQNTFSVHPRTFGALADRLEAALGQSR